MSNNTMIPMMKRAALVVIALLTLGSLAAPVAAQESEIAPEHLALARKYVELTDKGGVYEVALVQTAVQTMQQIVQQNPDLVQPTDEAISKTLEEFRGKKGDLLDQFARIYALQFSMDECSRSWRSESPVGEKLARQRHQQRHDAERDARLPGQPEPGILRQGPRRAEGPRVSASDAPPASFRDPALCGVFRFVLEASALHGASTIG